VLTYRTFAAVGPLILLATASIPLASAGTIVYNDLPNPIPQSSPSIGFQSNHTREFGDLIQPVGGATTLTSGTILMDGEALFADWSSFPGATSSGWSWPLTLNLYNVVIDTAGNPQVGTQITSVTQTFAIPWRPVGGPTGQDFLAVFNLPNVAVPSEFIFSIVYNTQTFGPNPTGTAGPHESLNVGLNTTAPPQVGTRPFPDTAYLNADKSTNYYCGVGASDPTPFARDTGWQTPFPPGCGGVYSIGAEFVNNVAAVPEPGTFGLLGAGLLALGGLMVRKRG
jgi:hypothetical protein